MKLYIINNYRKKYENIQGREKTDALICRIMGKSCLPISRDDNGKPYINVEGTFISVSHSNDTFALLVAKENVGIDIQYRRNLNFKRIADRYFSRKEKFFVQKHGEEGFFTLWTRKEAFAKYTGEGMKQIMTKEQVKGRSDIVFKDMKLEEDLFCSICCKGKESEEIEIEIHVFNGEQDI